MGLEIVAEIVEGFEETVGHPGMTFVQRYHGHALIILLGADFTQLEDLTAQDAEDPHKVVWVTVMVLTNKGASVADHHRATEVHLEVGLV